MISPISSRNAIPASTTQQLQPQPQRVSSGANQDTVHLSPQALAAAKGGDADHDGDSH